MYGRRIITAMALMLVGLVASAQADRVEVRLGNRLFKHGNWRMAEIAYRKAQVKDSTSLAASYNLASALYRQKDYDGAAKAMVGVKDQAEGSRYGADFWFNVGDVALQKQDWKTAVGAFRKSLILRPEDLEAKENYIYAKKKLEEEQNGGGGENDQNQDQNQDQDQNQQDQNQDEQQNQDQNQDNQDQDQNQEEQPQGEAKISPQQAQQMLSAIQAKEKETQDKVNKEKAALLQSRQKDKNW